MSKEMPIQQLLHEVHQLACNLNREELRCLLSEIAKMQPVKEREDFLTTLQKLSSGKAAPEESAAQDRSAELVKQIQDITEESEERRGYIENGEYSELDDWEDDRYGRGGRHDDEEPDAITEDRRTELIETRTQADHWFLDGEYEKALPVYRALIELEGKAREEFFSSACVCDMSTGEKYCRCVCLIAPKKTKAAELYQAIEFVAVNLHFCAGPFGESRIVPLSAVKDIFSDWTALQKRVEKETSWIAERLTVELLVLEGRTDDAFRHLTHSGAEQGPAWMWFLHELEQTQQWVKLTESSRAAVGMLTDARRRRAAELLTTAGIACGNPLDVAEGIRVRFQMIPDRRFLAELAGRVDDSAVLHAELEAYDTFLAGKPFNALHAMVLLLLGRFDEVMERCTGKPQYLGWSYSAPDAVAAAAGLLLVCRSAKTLPAQAGCFVARYLRDDHYSGWGILGDINQIGLWNQKLNRLIDDALIQIELTTEQRLELLSRLRKTISERVSRIVENKRRKSYGKAAEGIAAWAEAARLNGMNEEAAKLIDEFRKKYNRHHAFQGELNDRVK